MTARVQRELETRLGVFWSERTPLQVSKKWWLLLVAVALVVTIRSWTVSGSVMGIGFAILWIAVPLSSWLSRIPRAGALVARSILFYLAMMAIFIVAWWSEPVKPKGFLLDLGILAASLAAAAATELAFSLRRLKHDPRRSPARVRRVMLAVHRCPSCAMKLVPDTESPEALSRCPECGAVWEVIDAPRPRNPTHCVGCGYPLAGLPTDARHRTRCPECGRDNLLPMGPLAATSAEHVQQPPPRCWNCKRSLRGLPLINGDRVQCPDCGQWRSGLTAADVAPSESRS